MAEAFDKAALLYESNTFGKVLSCADEETERVKLFNLPAQMLPQGGADAAPAKGRQYVYTCPQFSRMVHALVLLITGVAGQLAVHLRKESPPYQYFRPFLIPFLPLLHSLLLPNPYCVEDVDRPLVVFVRKLERPDCDHDLSPLLDIR